MIRLGMLDQSRISYYAFQTVTNQFNSKTADNIEVHLQTRIRCRPDRM